MSRAPSITKKYKPEALLFQQGNLYYPLLYQNQTLPFLSGGGKALRWNHPHQSLGVLDGITLGVVIEVDVAVFPLFSQFYGKLSILGQLIIRVTTCIERSGAVAANIAKRNLSIK